MYKETPPRGYRDAARALVGRWMAWLTPSSKRLGQHPTCACRQGQGAHLSLHTDRGKGADADMFSGSGFAGRVTGRRVAKAQGKPPHASWPRGSALAQSASEGRTGPRETRERAAGHRARTAHGHPRNAGAFCAASRPAERATTHCVPCFFGSWRCARRPHRSRSTAKSERPRSSVIRERDPRRRRESTGASQPRRHDARTRTMMTPRSPFPALSSGPAGSVSQAADTLSPHPPGQPRDGF